MRVTRSISVTQSTDNYQLPKISVQKSNPFAMPQDLQMYKSKIMEKERKKDLQESHEQIHISQKGVRNSMEGKIRQFFGDQENSKVYEENIKIADAAKVAIKNRVKEQETMNDYIKKKREMFMFQMMINCKREQINKFQNSLQQRQQGLINTERNVEKDLEDFNEFLEANKNRARNAMRSAEDEMKIKQSKIHLLTELNNKKQELLTSNSQKLEMLQNLWKYKTFLDDLTPKEYTEKQNEQKDKIKEKSKKKHKLNLDMYKLSINQEIIDMLQQDNDDENQMFFQNPDQVEEIFQDWENKNLFQIQLTNEIQGEKETLLQENEIKMLEFDQRRDALVKQKNQLNKQIEQVNNEIQNLKIINHDNIEHYLFQDFEKQISIIFDELQGEQDKKNVKNITPVEMLKYMELKLEELIFEIKHYKDDKKMNEIFKKAEQKCIDQKREENKKQQRINFENDLLIQQAKLKNKKKGVKKIGRQVMKKYMVRENVVKKETIEEIDEEEQDRLKFFE